MILNDERSPKDSLYYIGAYLLKILQKSQNRVMTMDELLEKMKESDMNIALLYYALDWLYLMSLIEIRNERIYLK